MPATKVKPGPKPNLHIRTHIVQINERLTNLENMMTLLLSLLSYQQVTDKNETSS